MLNYRLLFLLALLNCYSNLLSAQYYVEKKIDATNRDNTTRYKTHFEIDNNGFLWYTINEGLVKKMGNHEIFYPYNHPNLKTIESDIQIVKTIKDRFVGLSAEGIFIFDSTEGEIKWLSVNNYYPYDLVQKKEYSVDIKKYVIDEEGNLWTSNSSNNITCITSENTIKHYQLSSLKGYETNVVSVLSSTKSGLIIFCLAQRIYTFHPKTFEVQLLNINTKVTHFLADKNGAKFSKNSSGYYYFKGRKYKYTYVSAIDKQIIELPYKFSVLKRERFNNQETLELYLNNNKSIEIYELNLKHQFVLKQHIPLLQYFNSLSFDAKGNFWINDAYKIKYIAQKKEFSKIFSFNKESIIFPNFRSIEKTNDGNLYVNRSDGLYKLKKNDTQFRKVFLKHKKDSYIDSWDAYGLFAINDSILFRYGLVDNTEKINLKNNKALTVSFSEVLKGEYIRDVEKHEKDSIFLGGTFGLYHYNIKTEKSKKIILDTAFQKYTKDIHDLYYDANKNELWVGLLNDGGMYCKNFSTGKIIHYSTNNTNYNLVNNNVYTIIPDGKDILWIGTDSGMQELNTKTLQSNTYNNKEGLINNKIVSLISSKNYIWAGSYNGLIRLNKKSKNIHIFFEEDGFSDHEYNKKSFKKINKDSLFFGGVNGLVMVKPEEIEFAETNNTLFLAEAVYFDTATKQAKTYVNGLEKIKLFNIPYAYNYLNLKFAINSYESKNQLSYKILGLRDDWVKMPDNNQLELLGLPSGSYRLLVKNKNRYGNQSNTLTYAININQVFYKTYWFVFLCSFVVLGIITLYFSSRNGTLKKKQTILSLEQKSLRAQMNPHFLFNSLSNIQHIMLTKGEEVANKYLTTYSNLLRLTIDMSNNEFISLAQELDYLNNYLVIEKLRLGGALHYTLDVLEELLPKEIFIPSVFFQPLIENAILHGLAPKKDNRRIFIEFSVSEDFLIGTIKDNGIGRAASKALQKQRNRVHKSRAMEIMKERIQIINSIEFRKIRFDIEDLYQEGKPYGTMCVVKIPILFKSDILKYKVS